jgi:hypothetical protein
MLRCLVDWKVKRVDSAVDCKVYAVWMGMLIGEVARRAGMKPQTVRYYEAIGSYRRSFEAPADTVPTIPRRFRNSASFEGRSASGSR